ncbi:hypothetical protein J9504_004734 [Escherichia coli]|uniref:hypothetical protein n=1 Tax=Escherichia coli TaxID=562 RepID=UPI000E1CB4B9|nr:hypothetical protein [Escherichia coli]EIE4690601.1 hypothetical protein [Escherichia coli]MCJ2698811.1 hypothetical protein [Escherichia coli]MCN3363406.1 hypothetical protein [Escherichia coli]RDS50326.1 hypothetical protein C3984_01206 [Escherichia coli]
MLLRYLIFIIFSIYVAGCSSNNLRKEELPEDMFAIIYGSDRIKKYEREQTAISRNINSGCIEALVFLNEEDYDNYSGYIKEYHKIAEGYRFLDENKQFMNKDSIELFVREINIKNELLCSRIKFESFQYMKNKFQQ